MSRLSHLNLGFVQKQVRDRRRISNKTTLTLPLSRPTGEGTRSPFARSFQSGWTRRLAETNPAFTAMIVIRQMCGRVGRSPLHSPSLPQTIQPRQRADEQAVACDGWSCHAHFVEGVFVQQLVIGAGREDVGVPVFAQRKNLSVRRPRRRGEGGVALRPDALLVVN